jgi:hypothetical protein
VISRPVLLPLRPILFDSDDAGGWIPRCTCSNGADCKNVGKHSALFTYRELRYGDEYAADVEFEGAAIKTGAHPAGSDVFVVDLDGEAAIERWLELGGFDGETRMVKTGRADGGVQLYFQHPGFHVKTSAGQLAPGIDIRGDGGIAVLEGSPHKAGPDARYELLTGETPPAPAPEWLLEWLRKQPAPTEIKPHVSDVRDPVEREHRRDLYAKYLETTPDIRCEANRGRGDSLLFNVVQRGAYDYRLPTEDVIDLIREHYDPRCDRPWGDELEERVTHKANDAKGASTRDRIEPPPSPLKDPVLANLFAPVEVEDPRELTFEDIAKAEKHGAAPDGLGFRFGGWDVEPPPPEFVVDGLIPVGSVGMFFGSANALKTWLLFDACIAVSQGKHWLGRATKKLKVGIVDYETGSNNLQKRLFFLGAGDDPNLGAVSMPRGEKPNDREFWIRLAKDACDVVIVDSLRRSNPGANENDSAEAILPLEHASDYSEAVATYHGHGHPGGTVIFIHHAKKSADDGWPMYRGSAGIEDQVDYAYAVRKVGGDADTNPDLKRIEIRCDKAGDFRQPEPFAVEVHFNDFERTADLRLAAIASAPPTNGSAVSAPPMPTPREETDEELRGKIRFALANAPGGAIASKKKIREQTGGRSGRVLMEIEALEELAEVVQIPERGFMLESPEFRRERVFKAAEDYTRWSSAAQLAKAATVPTAFVEGMLRDGYIVPKASGSNPHGYLIQRRDESQKRE